jgi:large subunit ribosomal protein L25
MAESVTLKAQMRTGAGSKESGRLRKQGLIPAVIYGHKETPEAIAVNARDFAAALHAGSRLWDLNIDGKAHKLLIKDVQYDHLGIDVLHADFMRVDLSEKVRLNVPLELKGTAKGIADGGVVDQQLTQIEVECVVTNIPSVLVVSIKDIGVGDALHAKDIQLPEGVTLVTDPEAIVLTCHTIAEEVAPAIPEAEAPTGPEVIGRKEKEEAAGEEEAK